PARGPSDDTNGRCKSSVRDESCLTSSVVVWTRSRSSLPLADGDLDRRLLPPPPPPRSVARFPSFDRRAAMASQEYLDKMQLRQSYRNLWHTDLMSTIQADFPFCCLALWCGPCVSYMLRKRALYNDMSRYVCCAGYIPCSGKCGESRCPEFCLCTEVFLCFGNSVASTRFLLQDEFNIQTTQCDNCIIGFMFCLQQVACIFSIVAMIVGSREIQEASQILSCMSDIVYWTVCACMQTQHKIEMDKRDGKFGPPPVMAVPPFQQMSRIDQPIPPPVGYGQPYGYG
ncbi:PLAC8 family, partial [Musa troglodytarum]